MAIYGGCGARRLTMAPRCLAFMLLAVGALRGAENLPDWKNGMSVNISGYGGAATLTNFPALVVLGEHINGFSYSDCKGDGSDLRFVLPDGVTQLDYETSGWNTGGLSYAWVRMPLLAPGSNVFDVLWGNAGAARLDCTTNGTVWSGGFVCVNHLDETAGTLVRDVTTNRYHGTLKGSGAAWQGALNGNGLSVAGAAWYELPDIRGKFSGNAATFSAWVKLAAATPATAKSGFAHLAGAGVNSHYTWSDGTCYMGVWRQNRVGGFALSGSVPRAAWHLVTITSETGGSGQWRMYQNGIEVKNVAAETLTTIPAAPYIGRSPGAYYMDGMLDEVRLANVARPADWVMADWLNVASNSDFMAYGAAKYRHLTVLGVDGKRIANNAPASHSSGSDFGAAATNLVVVDRVFTISNTSDVAINLTGAPAVEIEDNDGSFDVIAAPAVTQLDPGEATAFTVRFTPLGFGDHDATIAIESDLATAPLFKFAIAGKGDSGSEMVVLGTNGMPVASGSAAIPGNGTDMGLAALAAVLDVTHTFVVTNGGARDLVLSGYEFAASPGFSLDPSFGDTTIAPLGSTTFGIRFATATAGVFTATLTVSNNTVFSPFVMNFAAAASNTIQYVAVNGSDTNNGFAWASAKATVQAAVDAVSEGGEVIISNGLYSVAEPILVNKAVRVRGNGERYDTVITRQTGVETRLMVIDHAQAVVSDLCLSNGFGRALNVNNHSYGGAAWIKKGSLVRCIVTHSTSKGDAVGQANHNYHGYGGGIYMATGSVSNCEIRNNKAQGSGGSAHGYGGGIAYAAGEVAGCVITNNSTAGTGNGSGIGGGVYITGAGRLLNSLVNQNRTRAANSADCQGGGIYMSGNGLVSNTVVNLNDAIYLIPLGGGIYASAGLISHSLIASNLAECASGAAYDAAQTPTGAGVYLSGTAQLHNSIVLRNRAVHSYQYRMGETLGAGVFISGSAKVYHSTIVGNYGGERGYGDGVYISGGELKNSVVSHNFANYQSGAFTLNHDNVWQAGGTVSYNVLPRSRLTSPGIGNVMADPGFIDVYAGDFRLGPGSPAIDTTNTIAAMATDYNGAARPQNGSGAQSAFPDMGALEAPPLDQGSFRINFTLSPEDAFDSVNVTLQAHAAGESLGSLVYQWDFDGDGSPDVTGSDKAVVTNLFSAIGYHDIGLKIVSSEAGEASIVKRAAVHVTPSVLYLSDTGTAEAPYNTPAKASPVLQDIVNWAENGSEIRVAAGTYRITAKPVAIRRAIRVAGSGNTTTAFERNPASNTRLFIMAHADAELSDLTLRNGNWSNPGMSYGGAVWMVNGVIDRCVITNNALYGQPNQPGYGGAIYMSGGTLRNSLISRSSCGSGNATAAGGGVYISGGRIEHCTIVSNRVTKSDGLGGGIYQAGGTIVNTIAYYNWITAPTNLVRNIQAASGKLSATNSCASELVYDPNGTGNINSDPQFVDPRNDNWRLAENSPCMNAAAMLPWSATGADLTGGPRIRGSRADMGAYETQRLGTTVLFLR